MRRLRYNVAMSLDGFIADPEGGYDWIVADPTIDFEALFAQFDTFVMGRRTFEVVREQGGLFSDKEVIVCSRTLTPDAHPQVTVVRDDAAETVAALKAKPGRDVWLFGGGVLFRSLLDAGLVDTIEVAVIPVLLGDGTPLITPGARSPVLKLTGHRALPSGIVMLTYAVPSDSTGEDVQAEVE